MHGTYHCAITFQQTCKITFRKPFSHEFKYFIQFYGNRTFNLTSRVCAERRCGSVNISSLEIVFQILLASIQQDFDSESVSEPVQVPVVDVDTITQCKLKIIEAVFKDKPFSECPKPDDLDFGKFLCLGLFCFQH